MGETQCIECIESYVDFGSLMRMNRERAPVCCAKNSCLAVARSLDRSLHASIERTKRMPNKKAIARRRAERSLQVPASGCNLQALLAPLYDVRRLHSAKTRVCSYCTNSEYSAGFGDHVVCTALHSSSAQACMLASLARKHGPLKRAVFT